MLAILDLGNAPHDYIFSCLSSADLVSLSKVCKAVYICVSYYRRRAHNIYKLLAPYFSESELDKFRYMQFKTGVLISGSTALQLFGRVRYAESDLDLYAHHRFTFTVAELLTEVGYEYTPRESQDDCFTSEVEAVSMIQRNEEMQLAPEACHYSGASIAGVYDFTKGDQKIQLVTTMDSPLGLILSFHSTCVINFITHSNAYSLYPWETYIQNRALVLPKRSSLPPPLEKYEQRGWSMVHEMPLWETTYRQSTKESDFARGLRWIGDERCWVMPLPDFTTPPKAFPDTLCASSWCLRYSYQRPSIEYGILERWPKLRFEALGGNNSQIKVMKTVLSMIPTLPKTYYDEETNELRYIKTSFQDEAFSIAMKSHYQNSV